MLILALNLMIVTVQIISWPKDQILTLPKGRSPLALSLCSLCLCLSLFTESADREIKAPLSKALSSMPCVGQNVALCALSAARLSLIHI